MTCCDSAVALEKASGSGVSAKKHIFSGLLARARERNTMLAAERKKKSSLAKSPQVPHSATDARETCMAQLVLVAQQSRVIGELEMKLAKMEEDKVRLQNENTQLKFALKLNTKTIEGLRGELQKLAQAHQRTLSRCCKAHFSMGFCCASLFFPLLCVVACKKQETGKKSLFNVALVHALFETGNRQEIAF